MGGRKKKNWKEYTSFRKDEFPRCWQRGGYRSKGKFAIKRRRAKVSNSFRFDPSRSIHPVNFDQPFRGPTKCATKRSTIYDPLRATEQRFRNRVPCYRVTTCRKFFSLCVTTHSNHVTGETRQDNAVSYHLQDTFSVNFEPCFPFLFLFFLVSHQKSIKG